MTRTAMNELQQQIEQVRREAFAAGYAAAMQAVRQLASNPAPDLGRSAPRRRRGAARKTIAPGPRTTPIRRRRARASEGATRPGRSAAPRLQRGANAQRVEEILKASAPRALRPAEIRNRLKEKGIDISFTSVRHALSQLETRNAAEQVGDSRTWRHRGGAS
jgi:hypothetical protein